MTEKRFFYDCPLKAAWQVKYHDMQIVGLETKAPTESNAGSAWATIRDFRINGRFDVRPDSLHLMKALEGDLIFDHKDCRFGIIDYIADEGDRYILGCKNDEDAWSSVYIYALGETPRILERNGKAFHWPESEPT